MRGSGDGATGQFGANENFMINYAELLGAGGSDLERGSLQSGVTVTIGAANGSPVNTGILYGLANSHISFLGGSLGLWGPTYPRYLFNTTSNLTLADGTHAGIQGKVAFETNATSFDVRLYSIGYGSALTLLIDDMPVNVLPIIPPSGGSLRYITIDLSAAGLTPGFHKVEFYFYGGANFGGLAVQPGTEARALTDSGPRLVFLGDSFTEGNGAINFAEDYPSIVGRSLGIPDVWQSALGGTGWVKALGNRPGLVDRIEQDGVAANGDIYVIAMGVNDSPGIYSAAVDTLTKLTEGRPDAKIFVIGAWNPNGPAANPKAAINAEIAAAVSLFPNVVFLDPSPVTYSKSDATHPDAAGQWMLGEWLTSQLRLHLGTDGLIEQNQAGDVVGPVVLKGFDPAEAYSFTVLENGQVSSRFEVIPTGDAFPLLKLKDGEAVASLAPISLSIHITGSLGTDYTAPVDFIVRAHQVGSTGNDYMRGPSEGSFLDGGGGNDYLIGSAKADRLLGGVGQDKLDGASGADDMRGGADNDQYWVNHAGDIVVEVVGEGYDTVNSLLNGYALPEGVEGLNLAGTTLNGGGNALGNYLRGNALANVLYGHAGSDRIEGFGGDDLLYGDDGDDIIDGGAGIDRMTGGTGNDSFYVDNAADIVTEISGGGGDRVIVSAEDYTLAANVEVLWLTGSAVTARGNDQANTLNGNALANTLCGFGGADTFTGGGGDDTFVGGLGSDIFYVDDLGDSVVEQLNEGYDRIVLSTGGNFVMPGNVEVLELRGAATFGTGNDLDNYIYANVSISTINGGLGNDWLFASGGNDTLIGDFGNDVFTVDGPGVTVQERADEGYDRLVALVNGLVIPAYIEELDLSGTATIANGNDAGNYLRGAGLDDFLYGFGGNDFIEGQSGNDNLFGGAGHDRLAGGTGNDAIQGGADIDTVLLTGLLSDYALTFNADNIEVTNIATGEMDTLFEVERLSFTDGVFAINLADHSLIAF